MDSRVKEGYLCCTGLSKEEIGMRVSRLKVTKRYCWWIKYYDRK